MHRAAHVALPIAVNLWALGAALCCLLRRLRVLPGLVPV